ncbi:MAG: hypothetical protein G01um101419_34 [Parcubacteria group bacterium Gr01-1014_19]|nr:MAG: hypothetical protein G01um101419_34 [Parcubacteria group bacterium Gr01-1014_19]
MNKLNLAQLVAALKSGVSGAEVKKIDEKTILVETGMGTVEMMNEITWELTSRFVMSQIGLGQLVEALKSGVKSAKVKEGDEKTILVETDMGSIEMANDISWDLILADKPYSC